MIMVAYYQAAHNKYMVDRGGNVYLLDDKSVKKPSTDKDGYKFYTFHKSKYSHFSVRAARVVWEAWNGPIPEGMTVDHIDEDRRNNSIDNLQLLSLGDNVAKAKSVHYSFLSPTDEVFEGVNVARFAREYGLCPVNMSYVNSGKRKSHKDWRKNHA